MSAKSGAGVPAERDVDGDNDHIQKISFHYCSLSNISQLKMFRIFFSIFSLFCFRVIAPSIILSICNRGISYFISVFPSSDLTIKDSDNAASTCPIIAPSDENTSLQFTISSLLILP